MLLKRSEETQGKFSCFTDERLDGNHQDGLLQKVCWKRKDRGGDDWQVPEEGCLEFAFQLPAWYSSKDDEGVALQKFEWIQKVKPDFQGFGRLLRLYRSLRDV